MNLIICVSGDNYEIILHDGVQIFINSILALIKELKWIYNFYCPNPHLNLCNTISNEIYMYNPFKWCVFERLLKRKQLVCSTSFYQIWYKLDINNMLLHKMCPPVSHIRKRISKDNMHDIFNNPQLGDIVLRL